MNNLIRLVAVLTATLCSTLVIAADDPRIVEKAYDPTTVYSITISPGLATVIELETGEAVESIIVGDPGNWLVESTSSADRVVVKSSQGASRTNMTILTTKRTYSFVLEAYGGLDVFVLRFAYPNSTSVSSASYRMRGDKVLFPRLLTDNGRTTSVYWSADFEFPAVFVIDEDGDEVAPTFRAAGDGLIIDGVHKRLIFRRGGSRATAIRKVTKR